MSIIQEALKKVQDYTEDKEVVRQEAQKAGLNEPIPQAPGPIQATSQFSVRNPRVIALGSIALALVMILSIKPLIAGILSANTRNARKGATDQITFPSQEVVYKPISGIDTRFDAEAPILQKSIALKSQYPDLALNGIMFLDAGPRAIINNSIVGVGNTVGGATVTKINRKSVALEYSGVEITLNLK